MRFLVSLTHRQAAYWAEQWGWNPKDWRYIGEGRAREHLAGTNNPEVRYCGQYLARKDLEQIEREVWIHTRPTTPSDKENSNGK